MIPPDISQNLLPAEEGLQLSAMASLAASTNCRGIPASGECGLRVAI